VNLGILLGDENVTPTFGAVGDPNIVDSLVDDDWLFVKRHIIVFDADAGFIWAPIYEDIRVKRKVKSNQVLRVVASNLAGGNDVACRITARVLVGLRL